MIKYFSSHPTASNLLMIFFVVVGFTSISKLQKETFSKLDLKDVQIKVTYPGASTLDIEQDICIKIENAIDGVSNVHEIQCEARENIAITKVTMVSKKNWKNFVDDIKSEIDTIDNFPKGVDDITIKELGKVSSVLDIAISSNSGLINLKEFANNFKDELKRLEGISLVEITGVSDHQLKILVSKEKLEKYNITLTQIENILKSQNIKIPLGNIENQEEEYLVKFENRKKSVQELKELRIISTSNSIVKLEDIANIVEEFELEEDKIIFNGKRTLILNIKKTRSEDTIKISDTIKEFLDVRKLPKDIEIKILNNWSDITVDRLNLLVVNAIQGLILVFLTLWLFFKFRFAFWVAMGLPISFLGSFWVMNFFGISINMLSMVALLLAIGILMDDAIVISENIATEYSKGKKKLEAIVDGIKKVSTGVLSSFITTCAMFIPLVFLVGDIGELLKVIPIVLIIVLSVSLIEAFIILPRHLSHSLEKNEKPTKFRENFIKKVEYFKEIYIVNTLEKLIPYRYLFVGIVVAIFIISISMLSGGILKFQALPALEGDVVEARILMPSGTPLSQTKAVVEKILEDAKEINNKYKEKYKENLIKNYGQYFNKNLDSHEKGKHIATVSLELLTSEKRDISIRELIHKFKEKSEDIIGANKIVFKEPGLGIGGYPLEFRVYGDNLNQLKNSSKELETWLKSYKGVFYINTDLRQGKDEYIISLNDKALLHNITSDMVAHELKNAFYGTIIDEFQIDKENIEVTLKTLDNHSLQDLQELKIKSIPLNEICNITIKNSFSRINRIDSKRVVSIVGEIDTYKTNVNEIVADTQKYFLPRLQKKYPKLEFTVEGQMKDTKKTGASFLRNFLIGLFLVFILLSLQFKSYIEPIVVMMAIPLSFIGVIWGHIIMGADLTMPSILGFISLAGIVVNDSILLVIFLKSNIKALGIHKASVQASKDRFRAIMLTSITTIAGLIPLMFETSLQAKVLIPLAISIVFGLLASTILVLFIVPIFYIILEDFGFIKVYD